MDSLYVTDQESNWLSTLPPPSSEEIYGEIMLRWWWLFGVSVERGLDGRETWMSIAERNIPMGGFHCTTVDCGMKIEWKSQTVTEEGIVLGQNFVWEIFEGAGERQVYCWLEGGLEADWWKSKQQSAIQLMRGGAALVTEGKVRGWIDVDLSSE